MKVQSGLFFEAAKSSIYFFVVPETVETNPSMRSFTKREGGRGLELHFVPTGEEDYIDEDWSYGDWSLRDTVESSVCS